MKVAIRFFNLVLVNASGQPLIDLQPWQEGPIREIFGTQKGGGRQYTETYREIPEIPKKNGKSTLSAGIALKGLIDTDDDPNPHVYLAASSRDQATIIYRHAAEMG